MHMLRATLKELIMQRDHLDLNEEVPSFIIITWLSQMIETFHFSAEIFAVHYSPSEN